MSTSATSFWRWRFHPVWGFWGHLGIDYTFEDPADPGGGFLLRHIDYGLPGDRSQPGYRHSIARYSTRVAAGGQGWPPVRTPYGWIYSTSVFTPAPRAVGEFLLRDAPRFWGACGVYHVLGPNSNSGLRRTLDLCERTTGYRFTAPPLRFRLGAYGWDWRGELQPPDGPYPGYEAMLAARPHCESVI